MDNKEYSSILSHLSDGLIRGDLQDLEQEYNPNVLTRDNIILAARLNKTYDTIKDNIHRIASKLYPNREKYLDKVDIIRSARLIEDITVDASYYIGGITPSNNPEEISLNEYYWFIKNNPNKYSDLLNNFTFICNSHIFFPRNEELPLLDTDGKDDVDTLILNLELQNQYYNYSNYNNRRDAARGIFNGDFAYNFNTAYRTIFIYALDKYCFEKYDIYGEYLRIQDLTLQDLMIIHHLAFDIINDFYFGYEGSDFDINNLNMNPYISISMDSFFAPKDLKYRNSQSYKDAIEYYKNHGKEKYYMTGNYYSQSDIAKYIGEHSKEILKYMHDNPDVMWEYHVGLKDISL